MVVDWQDNSVDYLAMAEELEVEKKAEEAKKAKEAQEKEAKEALEEELSVFTLDYIKMLEFTDYDRQVAQLIEDVSTRESLKQ